MTILVHLLVLEGIANICVAPFNIFSVTQPFLNEFSNAKFETLFEMYLQHFQVKISFWALLRHFSVHSHSRTGILEKKMHKVGKKKSAQIANPSKNPPAQIQWEVDFSHF